MALFNSKTEKNNKKETAVATSASTPNFSVSKIGKMVIVKPRITEKSGIQSERDNVYTFEVHKDATKGGIKKAIKEIYNIAPLKVRIVKLPAKKVFTKGKAGSKSAVKKALVYLKKGDKIAFI